MATKEAKEAMKLIESIKASVVKQNNLKPLEKKLMHTWFKYFDQNLKGVSGLDVKLDMYRAFHAMAKAGVLVPPFNKSPFDKENTQFKGTSTLQQFWQKYDKESFKKKVYQYKEMKQTALFKEPRPKSAPARKEASIDVIQSADEEEPEPTSKIVSRPEMVKRSKSTLSVAGLQQLKKNRLITIKSLENDIIHAGKKLPPNKQDMIEAWIKTLNDKLKRETELEDRITALQALKTSLTSRQLLPPFDEVPARGKLNVREFMSNINLEEMEEKAMLAMPTKKVTRQKTDPNLKTPQRKISKPDLANPRIKNDAIQAVMKNVGKVLDAICDEDVEVIDEIPTLADQIEEVVMKSPHRIQGPLKPAYDFTPLVLDDVPYESEAVRRAREEHYDPLENIEVDHEIQWEDQPGDLDDSIYDDNDDAENYVDEYLVRIPETIDKYFGPKKTSKEIEIAYDPNAFATDSPEFDFIPVDIKAYIRRIVKKELIHWPPFIQELGRKFHWPSTTNTADLIKFA